MKLTIIIFAALAVVVMLVTSSDAATLEQQLEEVLNDIQNEKREGEGEIDDGLQYDALEHGSSALSMRELFVSITGSWLI